MTDTLQNPRATDWPPHLTPMEGMVVLPDTALVQVSGPDAATFLHSQITQDVLGLTASSWRLGGHCSAKGRLQASFVILQPAPQLIWLLLDASLLPTWLQRLRMFVLRAKVTLTHASDDHTCVGMVGQTSARAWSEDAGHMHVGQVTPTAGGQLLRLSDVQQQPRWLWVGPSVQVASRLAAASTLPATHWQWLDTMSGIPTITQATSDQFVPQMVNFELLGGVNFQKGCYPGQEVVARSQYRGSVKRRMYLARSGGPLSPMQEIFAAQEAEEPAGVVLQAAPVPGDTGWWSALVVLKVQHAIEASHTDSLRVGSATGPALQLDALPYEITTESAT